METEAKGWSVPTCSQEEPCRRGGGTLRAAGPRLCHPPGFRELAAPHADLVLSSNCPQGLATPRATSGVHRSQGTSWAEAWGGLIPARLHQRALSR